MAKGKKKNKDVKPEQTDVTIPQSVIDAGAKADEIQDGIIDQGQPAADKGSKTDKTDTAGADGKKPDGVPGIDIPADPPTKVVDAPAAQPADDGFENKYNILQGKYNSEMGRLNEQVNTLSATVTKLTGMLESQVAEPVAVPAAAAQPAADVTDIPLLDVSKFEGYGEEFVNMATQMNKLASQLKTQASGAVPAVDSKLEQRIQQVERTTFQTAEQTFFSDLNKEIPKAVYEVINSHADFPAWLAEQDPISTYQRKEMLDFAFKNLRSPQVVAILKQFAGEKGIDIPAASSSQVVVPAADASIDAAAAAAVTVGNLTDKTVDDPLAAQAMPGQTVGSGGDDLNQPVTANAAQYNVAVKDYTAGRITKQAFEKIEAAFHQGLGVK